MPHKRKSKKSFTPQLKFEPENSYLYLAYHHKLVDDSLVVPLDSLVILFTLQFCDVRGLKVRFLKTSPLPGKFTINVRKEGIRLDYQVVSETKVVESEVLCCPPPLWYLPGQRTCIAGLCSVARYSLRLAGVVWNLELCTRLLGFQQGCLSAPREVSTWTKFCEEDAQEGLNKLTNSNLEILPEEISRFEAHLKQPVRMHNIRNKMQKSGDLGARLENGAEVVVMEDGVKVDPIQIYAKSNHVFAEGPEILLSDVLIFPIFYLLHAKFKLVRLFPSVSEWFDTVSSTGGALAVMEDMLGPLETEDLLSSLAPAEVPAESLYKSDPSRDKEASFTKQADIEQNLGLWLDSGLDSMQQGPLCEEDQGPGLDWDLLPPLVHPLAGHLPQARVERKCDQLESLARPVVKLAKPGMVVVDFCSGGGHLGLLLAHLLPSCTLHLVENKEESLARARERGLALGLQNIWFFQSNLDFYQSKFHVGTSLHACGLATDLVISKCTQQRAAFVCCPCCYGAVRPTSQLTFPRSVKVRGVLDLDQYLVLGHTADQTQVDSGKVEQGRLCMDLVDTDRGLGARELGYSVKLGKLRPLDCSPKNNILVGASSDF